MLKPGGTTALIAELYRDAPRGVLYVPVMRLIRARLLTDTEHRRLLTDAGFTDVTTHHQVGQSWICANGRRPA